MSKAFIFPGQAAQYVGMGQDLYQSNSIAKSIFDRANEIIDYNLLDVCFNGPMEVLTETDVTQPAVFTHSYASFMILKDKGMQPDVVAGHSLGEFNALVAANVLSFEDALKIVIKRGQLMKKCNEQNPGTMAAVLKFDIDKIREACDEVDDVVQVANFNSDGQIVISGSINGVHKAMEVIKGKGARIVKELQVGGAFHSPLMKPAEDELAEIINSMKYNDTSIPVYTNVNAQAEQNGANLKELSIKQLTSSVLWFDTMMNMNRNGVTEYIECGPGNILSGINKRLTGEFPTQNFDKIEDFSNL